jgi:hypothetical protein
VLGMSCCKQTCAFCVCVGFELSLECSFLGYWGHEMSYLSAINGHSTLIRPI